MPYTLPDDAHHGGRRLGQPPAQRQVNTLVHELAPALLRADRQPDDPQLDAAGEELFAETVVFCSASGGCRHGGWLSVGDGRYPLVLSKAARSLAARA